MILIPHLIAGALVGAKIQNPAGIFLIAVTLHFLLDIIPHWDYWDYLKGAISEMPPKKFRQFMGEAMVDLVLGIFIIWLIFKNSPLPHQNIAWGAFCGILPDGLVLLNQITKEKNNYLSKFQNFHDRLHWLFIKNKKIPLWLGILTETITMIVLLFLIWR